MNGNERPFNRLFYLIPCRISTSSLSASSLASIRTLLFFFYAVFKDQSDNSPIWLRHLFRDKKVPENRTVDESLRFQGQRIDLRVSGYLFNPACSLERR